MFTTAWDQFKFGLFFGMGLFVAYAVLKLILMVLIWLLSHAGPNNFPQVLP